MFAYGGDIRLSRGRTDVIGSLFSVECWSRTNSSTIYKLYNLNSYSEKNSQRDKSIDNMDI